MWKQQRSELTRGYVGQKVGERTITGISHEDAKGTVFFIYECECGFVGHAPFKAMQSHPRCRNCGLQKSCLKNNQKRIDGLNKYFDEVSKGLIGRRFGCIVVLEFVGSDDKNHRCYRVKCNSGVEYIARRTYITRQKGLDCKHCYKK